MTEALNWDLETIFPGGSQSAALSSIDLTRPDFWETTVKRLLADVDEFVTLANQ